MTSSNKRKRLTISAVEKSTVVGQLNMRVHIGNLNSVNNYCDAQSSCSKLIQSKPIGYNMHIQLISTPMRRLATASVSVCQLLQTIKFRETFYLGHPIYDVIFREAGL